MAIDAKAALADIDSVLGHNSGKTGLEWVYETTAMYKACIIRWAPPGSPYRALADSVDYTPSTSISRPVQQMRGPLAALRRDYEAGAIATFEELVHGNVFGDLLDQADHLHENGYELAAAVVAGAALESHFRALASKHGVPPNAANGKPKMATPLNEDLRLKSVYSLAQQRSAQAWIDCRNDAAHGKADFNTTYNAKDIENMITGAREFIARYPA